MRYYVPRKILVLFQIALLGGLLLVRGMTLFAAPPLDSQVALAGAGHDAAGAEARNRLLTAAAAYQGTPYRYGGLDRNGLDCSGFIYASFKDSLAVSVPRTTSALYNWAEKIEADILQPGDLVFFITTGRNISHAGIYTGEGQFIHSASEGPQTGVIYSRLDESYWQKNFAGAGRALPEASASTPTPVNTPAWGGSGNGSGGGTGDAEKARGAEGSPWKNAFTGKGFVVGAGFAPTWSGFLERDNPLRGAAVQGRFAWKGTVLGQNLMPGFEIRPEWDDALGVFRMPFTLSLGFDDRLRFFFGPAFTLGTPVLKLKTGDRPYEGGTSWLGAAGITVAPLSFPVSKGKLDIYGEFAWQSYYGAVGTAANWNADMSAGLRFSTGLRYTWDL
jgi:probable lipoprotein NlpC